MSTIDFCVWSPNEATFWAGWIAAGIVDADHNPTPEYANGFVITEQPADQTTGFPAGYRNADGVTYCDVRDLSSPSNVWA